MDYRSSNAFVPPAALSSPSVPQIMTDAFEVTSLPSTPPGSIRSNESIPAFSTEEEHRKAVTRETYDQLLKKMERGELHEKGYEKPQSKGGPTKTWVHPPTLSSPPRKKPRQGGTLNHTQTSPDLQAITQDIR